MGTTRTLIIGLLLVALPGSPINAQTAALRIAIPREEGSLNPYSYQTGYPGWSLMTLVYDTLFYPDLNNEPQPWLAQEAKVSPDGKNWTLTLRKGLRWHDGQPLTSEDVKFTFEYVKKFTHSRWTFQTQGIESVETQGPQTTVFRLAIANANFKSEPLADVPILPKHIWDSVTQPRQFNNVVGSGPYKIAEIKDGQFYRLMANDTYFMGRPRVQMLVLAIIPDTTVSFTALQAGEVDVNSRFLLPELVAQFEKFHGIKIVRGPGFASTLLQFNAEHQLLKDVRLRRAMIHAINAGLMAKLLVLGFAVVGTPGYLHPASPDYNPNINFTPSKSRAVAILNEAGYIDRSGRGGRGAPDGTPLRFTLLTRSGDPLHIRAADLIRTWLKDIGIDIQVRVQDDASMLDVLWPGLDVCKGRKFDMAIFGWSAPVMTRPGTLRNMFHSNCHIGTINIGGYKNPEFDRLADQLVTMVEPARQKEIVFKLQEIVARDVPIHTLFYRDVLMAFWRSKYDHWAFQKGQGIINKFSFVTPSK